MIQRLWSFVKYLEYLIAILTSKVDALVINVTGSQTTFVFQPGGTAGKNVYTDWATLVTAAAAVSGPRIVEFDDTFVSPCVIPAGAWNFGKYDVQFFGLPTSVQAATNITVVGTLSGVYKFVDVNITYSGAVPCIAPPASVVVNFVYDGATIQTSGAGVFVRAGAGVTVQALVTNASNIAGGTANAMDAAGAGSLLIVATDAQGVIGPSVLGASAGGTTFSVGWSPSVNVSQTQAGITGGLVYGVNSFVRFGNPNAPSNLAITDLSSTVPPTPANQTASGADSDVLAAILTMRVTGRIRVYASLNFAATSADTVVVKVKSHTKAAVMILLNQTPTGLNCFFQTAPGGITYGGGTVDVTHRTKSFVIPASPVAWSYEWPGIIGGTAGQGGFPLNNNVAVALSVQDATNSVTGMTGSISAEEIIYG